MSDQGLPKRKPVRALVLYNYVPVEDLEDYEDEVAEEGEEIPETSAKTLADEGTVAGLTAEAEAEEEAEAEAEEEAEAEAEEEAEADEEAEAEEEAEADEEADADEEAEADEYEEGYEDEEAYEDEEGYEDEYEDEYVEEEYDPVLAGLSRPEIEVYDVARALMEEGGFAVNSVNIEDDVTRLDAGLVVNEPAVVFNMVQLLEHDDTQRSLVAAYLDLHGHLYTGSGSVTLSLCQDRSRTRALLHTAGITVPPFAVVRSATDLPDMTALRYPLVISQAYDDNYAREGIDNPITDLDHLGRQIRHLEAVGYQFPYLVEEYITGRRIHAIIIGNRGKIDFLPLTETSISGDGRDATICELPANLVEEIHRAARDSFEIMGCRDYAQIDFHLDEAGNAWVIDVRPMIDMHDTGPFCVAAGATEPGFDGVVVAMAGVAMQRIGLPMPPRPIVKVGEPSPPPEELLDMATAEDAEAEEAEAEEAEAEEAEAEEAGE
jgi:D-alanine-D-alanine ligase-like ATP-grasp enzyme